MIDFLVFFLLGVVFGASAFSLLICRYYEGQAYLRGSVDGYMKCQRLMVSRRRMEKNLNEAMGFKVCKRISFGVRGNLKRWQPIDEPIKAKKK